jgi:tetratricopeptide (TPR) repeat protein
MKAAPGYESKLQQAIERIKQDYGDDVLAIFVIGSITQEATPRSDCDVSVVFRDHYYNEKLDFIRARLHAVSADLNRDQPEPELVFWPTKQDHYVTLFPDVSYIRRNLPDEVGRLDAWCGLAKFTLLAYECAASRRVHGTFDLQIVPKKIPSHECLELFLLSTRTLAEGLAELQSADTSTRKRGINHVAKAGLRAAYAATIRADRAAHNTYKQIFEGACEHLPKEHHGILAALFHAKTQDQSKDLDVEEALSLMRHCETRIADTRRQSVSGLTMGRAGESFAFDLQDLTGGSADPVKYSRFPGFTHNYIHSLYFLMSAREIVKRFNSSHVNAANILDFFYEELTILATFGVFNPNGVRIVVGRGERSVVEVPMGLAMLQELAPMLSRLGRSYVDGRKGSESIWLSRRDRLLRLQTVLLQLARIRGVEVPADVCNELKSSLGGELDLACILEWQHPLLEGLIGPHAIHVFTEVGLALYQSGKLKQAETLLQRVTTGTDRQDARSELGPAAAGFDLELSKAHQYLAITCWRQGEKDRARGQFEKALGLDPDNYSALDDFAEFLLAHDPPERAVARLLAQLDHCRGKRSESEEQVANRFHNQAIDLKQAGDFEEACFFYEHALALSPRDARVHYNYGLLKQQLGDVNGAADLYLQAIEIDANYPKPYLNLGVLFEKAQQLDKAISVLSAAVERGIADEHAYTNLGNCWLAKGDLETASQCYDLAISIDPEFANALVGKGNTLINGPKREDPETIAEAAECFRRACLADPTFTEAEAMYERLKTRLQRRKDTQAKKGAHGDGH